jgi:hypothetical protein
MALRRRLIGATGHIGEELMLTVRLMRICLILTLKPLNSEIGALASLVVNG